ncbi:MAG: DNA polymerase-3 subunit beta [Bacteroidia bacterium]|jgi:DNA polymerase-3 subunit beta
MKFIVSSDQLLKSLQSISGVLNTSNTLPILDNFLFDIKAGELTISGSDLETTMITKLEITSKEEGIIAIPARLLLDTLKTFPETPLTFTVNSENHGIEISSESGRYKLSGLDGSEFPKAPELEASSSVTLTSDLLSRAIIKTLFASGNDDLRPVMSGVLFELHEDHMTFVATDAHKLVRYMRTDAKATAGANFIMPKKPLTLLKNVLISEDEEEVKLEYTETNARFSFGNITLICRLIDGRYPNYDSVIPKENPNKMTISRQALLTSIKRVSIFSNKTTHQVKLKIAGNELQVSAEDMDFANEAVERLTCSYQGEDMEIGFNSRFLAEMLTNQESEDIVLEMSQPNRAGIVLPAEKVIDEEDTLMLVMPVMLNS